MLYIPKIDEYLKILTDKELKDFVIINFSEYFKSTTEKLYSKLNKKQNLRKVAKSLYISLKTPDEVEKYLESNSSDNSIHLYNVEILNLFDTESELKDTKSTIKTKLKELLSKFKKFKVKTVLVLGYKKRNDRKIFYSCNELIASDSDIDEALKSMHQSIITKIKNYYCEDWIVWDVIIKPSINIFEY